MKWSDLDYGDFYEPWDENQKAIRGFWLIKQGIDLENLPMNFNEKFRYFERIKCNRNTKEERKVYLKDIIGTSNSDYGNMEIIKSYMRIKRAKEYIINDSVTKYKYDKMLRKTIIEQEVPVILTESEDGTYFVNGNGNHRIIFYKMMMLSEIALKYSCAYKENFDFTRDLFKDVTKKYWINAEIRKPC